MNRRHHVRRTLIRAALVAGVAWAGVAGAATAAGSGTAVFVPGRADPWTTTGLQLTQGQTFTVRADGAAVTWLSAGPGSVSGPAGQPFICVSSCAVDGAPYGALVAQIGASTIVIGSGGTFTAPADGALELAVNDNLGTYYDNSGGYATRVAKG